MNRLKQTGIRAALLVVGYPLWAADGVPYDTPIDEPKPAAASLFHAPTRLKADGSVIDSGPSWGHSGPWIEDVDGDGVRDLIVGDFSGLFRVYHNRGSNREPRYAAAVNLQAGGFDAKVPIY